MGNIQKALSRVVGDGAAQANLTAAAAQVAGAMARISRAMNSSTESLQASDLAALESAVQSADVGSSYSESPAAAGVGLAAIATAQLAAASTVTRSDVESLSHDVFDQHIFDRYLHFKSAQDEAAFRQHAASVQAYVKSQLARQTAEGNLNAGGGMMDYMLDAQAHGAGDSPDFMPRWNKLAADTERQRAAMVAAGQSTAEFDRNLNTQVRSFLKARGLSDVEVADRLANAASPQDAVKPFLQSENGRFNLKVEVQRADTPSAASQDKTGVGATGRGPTPDGQLTIDFSAMEAKLRAAGLRPADDAGVDAGHGLGVQKPARNVGQAPGDQ